MTFRKRLPLLVGLALLGLVLGLLVSRSHTSVTRARLERSLPTTFARLYVQQAALLGHEGITTRSLHARAQCDKGGPKVADERPGNNWICLMTWKDPNLDETLLPGKFELNVRSNACYTAGGPSKIIGLATIADAHGNDVANPVFEFDSCFDPHGSNRPTGVSIPTTSTTTSATATVAALTLPQGSLTVAHGVATGQLQCSAGDGGCGGTIAATLDGKRLAPQTFALAAGSSGTVSFPVGAAHAGAKLTLDVHPTIGAAPQPHGTVTLAG